MAGSVINFKGVSSIDAKPDLASLTFAHHSCKRNPSEFSKRKRTAMAFAILHIIVLLVTSHQNCDAFIYRAGSLIWRSNLESFIPIINISTYEVHQRIYLDKIREQETHNFQGRPLTLAYYEEKNLMNFEDNNTRISGVCGELWNMLSEYLNFTLIMIRVNISHYGSKQPNGSWDGLLGMLHRDEIQVIPRTAFFVAESQVMDYTTPIWENRYRLYIRPEWTSDGTWMLHMFSKRVWCSILVLFLILSVLGYALQRISFRVSGAKQYPHNLHDHLFYTFATICSQGFIPDSLYYRTKILGLSKKMFAWLLLIVLSSHLISYMTNRQLQLPFDDFESMFNGTSYNIVVFNGSMVYSKFQRLTAKYKKNVKYRNRFYPVHSTERMYQKGCWGKKKYAIFEAEDRKRAFGNYVCKLAPAGQAYFPTWVASGVSKGYRYKRTFDLGILKLNEFGLTDGMKDRWMESAIMASEAQPFDSINLNQVSMLFLILFMGMIVSVIIFICENITATYEYNRQKVIHLKSMS